MKTHLINSVVLILLLCFSCSNVELTECSINDNTLFEHTNFPIGAAVDLNELENNNSYEHIVNSQFNSITAENIFKPAYLHPQQGEFNFNQADELVNYCSANEKRIYGHTLIWHQQIPSWMEQFNGTTIEWEEMLQMHIQTIVAHFRGKVAGWDVVNEAFYDDGTLRNTIWKQNLGEEYIEKAFRFAREADPDVHLFYNDYSITGNSKKRSAILNFLNELRGRGVPVDGIGLQMHISIAYPKNSDISNAINEIWENDYIVHISELDVSINPKGNQMPAAPARLLDQQAEKFLYIFNTYQQIPSQYQYGITCWGVSDKNTWIRYVFNRDDYPLLFDDDYIPKPAFCRLIKEL